MRRQPLKVLKPTTMPPTQLFMSTRPSFIHGWLGKIPRDDNYTKLYKKTCFSRTLQSQMLSSIGSEDYFLVRIDTTSRNGLAALTNG